MALPAHLVLPFTRLIVNTVSCTTAFAQKAAVAALEGPWEPVDAMVAEFEKRRAVIVEGLNRLPGVTCAEPGGAFYANSVEAIREALDAIESCLPRLRT